MAKLTTMKSDRLQSIQEHTIEITNIITRLKTLGMTMNDSFIILFILNSLPSRYGAFQINYNNVNDKWNVNELIGKLILKENRIKNLEGHFVNLVHRVSKG